MSQNTTHAVSVVIGIFCVSMGAAAFMYYGWYAIVTMLIGLFVFAAIIASMTGGDKDSQRRRRK